MNTSNTLLIKRLFDSGLIVFGQFFEDNQRIPYRVNLDYLPSYPQLMSQCVTSFVALHRPQINDFVASYRDSIAFTSLVANEIGSRHVYTFHVNQTFVGSYDVGHDTTLIMLSYEGSIVNQLRSLGNRVGLNISNTLCLFSLKQDPYHKSVLYMIDIINYAVSEQIITEIQAQSARDFIHHQG